MSSAISYLYSKNKIYSQNIIRPYNKQPKYPPSVTVLFIVLYIIIILLDILLIRFFYSIQYKIITVYNGDVIIKEVIDKKKKCKFRLPYFLNPLRLLGDIGELIEFGERIERINNSIEEAFDGDHIAYDLNNEEITNFRKINIINGNVYIDYSCKGHLHMLSKIIAINGILDIGCPPHMNNTINSINLSNLIYAQNINLYNLTNLKHLSLDKFTGKYTSNIVILSGIYNPTPFNGLYINNTHIEYINFPVLSIIENKGLFIADNPHLHTLLLPNLKTISNITGYYNIKLTLNFPKLVNITGNGIQCIDKLTKDDQYSIRFYNPLRLTIYKNTNKCITNGLTNGLDENLYINKCTSSIEEYKFITINYHDENNYGYVNGGNKTKDLILLDAEYIAPFKEHNNEQGYSLTKKIIRIYDKQIYYGDVIIKSQMNMYTAYTSNDSIIPDFYKYAIINGSVYIDNISTDSVDLSNIICISENLYIGSLLNSYGRIDKVVIDNLITVNKIFIYNQHYLKHISFKSLVGIVPVNLPKNEYWTDSIAKELECLKIVNTSLEYIDLPALVSIKGKSVEDGLFIINNKNLKFINIPVLIYVNGVIGYNNYCLKLVFKKLQFLGEKGIISLGYLTSDCGRSLQIKNCVSLVSNKKIIKTVKINNNSNGFGIINGGGLTNDFLPLDPKIIHPFIESNSKKGYSLSTFNSYSNQIYNGDVIIQKTEVSCINENINEINLGKKKYTINVFSEKTQEPITNFEQFEIINGNLTIDNSCTGSIHLTRNIISVTGSLYIGKNDCRKGNINFINLSNLIVANKIIISSQNKLTKISFDSLTGLIPANKYYTNIIQPLDNVVIDNNERLQSVMFDELMSIGYNGLFVTNNPSLLTIGFPKLQYSGGIIGSFNEELMLKFPSLTCIGIGGINSIDKFTKNMNSSLYFPNSLKLKHPINDLDIVDIKINHDKNTGIFGYVNGGGLWKRNADFSLLDTDTIEPYIEKDEHSGYSLIQHVLPHIYNPNVQNLYLILLLVFTPILIIIAVVLFKTMVFCDLCDDAAPRKPIYSQHQAISNNIGLSTIHPVIVRSNINSVHSANNTRSRNDNHTLPPDP